MSQYKVIGFSDTYDLFAVMVLSLPDDFPPHAPRRSLGGWFDLLFGGIDSVIDKMAKKPEALAALREARTLCEEAKALYEKGEIDAGRFRLAEGETKFAEARKLAGSRKPAT